MLSFYLINDSDKNFYNNIDNFIDKILSSYYYSTTNYTELKEELIKALKYHDRHKIKIAIDQLFFQLFNLDGKILNNLLKRYYNF